MGLKKLAAKVDDYNARLQDGKASKIKRGHVEKVLTKLRKKSEELDAELAKTKSEDKSERILRKRAVTQAHIERAEWLLAQIE